MAQPIKINFSGFWCDFNKTDNYFYNLLKPHYKLEISDDPDFLFYSFRSDDYKKHKCIRIYYTGENMRPNFRECDYAFTHDYLDNPNHYRLPHYALYKGGGIVIKGEVDIEKILKGKMRFCNFVYSNQRAKERNRFFHKLSKYKRIDSGGRYLNNIGGPVKDKLEFIKRYKFTIAFENSSYPGYTTEKIYQPMLVNSIPIYWGNKLVDRDFNPKSFLNYYDFKNENALIERIIEVDQNDNLYREYLEQPFLHDNKPNQFADPQNVLKQFDYIFNTPKTPVALEKKPLLFFRFAGSSAYQ